MTKRQSKLGANIKVKAKMIEVEGPKGKLVRNFKHLNLDLHLIKEDEIGKCKPMIEVWFGFKKSSTAILTALSHVESLITGVTKGYRYKIYFIGVLGPDLVARLAKCAEVLEI